MVLEEVHVDTMTYPLSYPNDSTVAHGPCTVVITRNLSMFEN